MSRQQDQSIPGTPGIPYAAIHARVSTEDQGKGFSLPTQIEACQKLAEREGYVVSETSVLVDEGISGTTMDRPGLRTLRDLVNSKAITAVVVYHPDRLSRNLGHQLLLAEEYERAGVKLLIVSHPLEQGPEGWLFFQMRGALAEYERAKILERARRGMKGRAQKGHPNGGQVPLGYRYIMEPHRGHWELDEDEAPVVRRIFAMCLAGAPVRAIARQLTAERVQTRLDRRPKSGGKKRNGPGVWTFSSVHHILRNETYAGRAYFGRKERLTKTLCRRRDPGEWVRLAVPAILDDETFEAAQAQLRNHQMTATRNRRHDYLLAGGFLRCAQCGRMMTGRMTSRGKRRYRCTSRTNVLNVAQRCRGSLAADEVEGRVWRGVEQVLHNPALIAAEVQRQQAHSDELTTAIQRDLALVASALMKCQREEERWTAAYGAELIDLTELKAYRAEIAARRQGLQDQEQSLHAQLASVQHGVHQVEALISYCTRVRQQLQTFDINEKRLALQALAIQVTWAMEQPLQVKGTLPLDEGSIVSSTAKGVMRPPFSAGSNQAGGIVTCMA
jgi:site-specific DNA recombinase